MTAIPDLRALLVVEIGNLVTRVTLVDGVEGETRLISQAEAPSSIDLPHEDAMVALLSGAQQISDRIGRQLVRDGMLIMPQNSERDGIDAVVAVTSAAGMLGLVVVAIAGDISARSALRASRSTYTSILQVVTLDDAARAGASAADSWIERQVQTLTQVAPDCLLLAGGLEQGAEDAVVRLAHLIGVTSTNSLIDDTGQQRQEVTRRPIIYAGNSAARGRVEEALSGRADLTIVDNLRPSLETEHLEPTYEALNTIYNQRILGAMGAVGDLRRILAAPLQTVSMASGLMTRFIAEQYQRTVLTVDCGAANTSLYLARSGDYAPVVLAGLGTGLGVSGVIAERGLAQIARWLPFPIDSRELMHRLLNKSLRPYLVPATREELLIELAVAREALAIGRDVLADVVTHSNKDAVYDLLIAGGSVLSHAPHPGYAALVLLDSLQLMTSETVMSVELHLDTLSLMAVCGALAANDPAAAVSLFERDLLQNTPLATCAIALGEGRAGEPAVTAELAIVGGETLRVSVAHGAIGRLPLAPGQYGTLTLRPAAGVRIGRNAPGEEVPSEIAAIRGSTLGVIIDARDRPLQLPDAPYARQQLLWQWLVALGAEQGELPYAEAAPFEEPPLVDVPVEVAISPRSPRVSEPKIDTSPPGSSPSIDKDLARLRQTVEQPKKRGFFRRS